jgi:hypothetical protein
MKRGLSSWTSSAIFFAMLQQGSTILSRLKNHQPFVLLLAFMVPVFFTVVLLRVMIPKPYPQQKRLASKDQSSAISCINEKSWPSSQLSSCFKHKRRHMT